MERSNPLHPHSKTKMSNERISVMKTDIEKPLLACLANVSATSLTACVAFLFLPELNHSFAKLIMAFCLLIGTSVSLGIGARRYIRTQNSDGGQISKTDGAEYLIAAVIAAVINCTFLSVLFATIN